MYDQKLNAWEATAEKAREEGRPIPPLIPSSSPLGVLLLGLTLLAASLAYQALFVVVEGSPIYLWLSAVVGSCLLCIAYYLLRDVRKWRSFAVLQILVSCAVGAGVLFASGSLPTSLGEIISAGMGIVGAVISGADGIEKLSKLQKEHEGRAI
ncbi:MAG TPA: hypothetical protein VGM09_26220 [Bradyrhizobium sp.]